MSKGIDIPIDSLRTMFQTYLWKGKNRSFYGRVFRNERFADFGSKVSPEVWLSANNYIEVLKDIRYDAQCFFDIQPSSTVNTHIHTSDVWLCFMVNLQALYPTLTRTEATEKVCVEIEKLLVQSDFVYEGLIRGYQGFMGYDWGEDRTTQAKADMSPHYLLRFNLKVSYSISNCL